MANVVAMTCRAAMVRFTRCLYAGALVARIAQRMAAVFAQRVCAAWPISIGLLPPVRQQRLDAAVEQCGQSREHIFQVPESVTSPLWPDWRWWGTVSRASSRH